MGDVPPDVTPYRGTVARPPDPAGLGSAPGAAGSSSSSAAVASPFYGGEWEREPAQAAAGAGAAAVGAAAAGDPAQIGPYVILERISEGGMGIVYKAEQRAPVRRVVALKVIKVGMDTKEVVARFDAERQALALMSHPNVAKVFEAGMTEAGRPYFAMEYVPGVPLTDYCDEHGLNVRERLALFVQVCQAIQHAHQKGIIHRDLKPSNILVALLDGRPVPKVIDFGIAKATNQALTQHTLFTQTGTMVGTPEYASPEQAATGGLDVDTRTDVYSLGVILYQLLTGTLPLDPKRLRNAGPEQMVRMIREEEPPRPSTRLGATWGDAPAAVLRSDGATVDAAGRTRGAATALRREVRGDLDWITLRAMEKDRARRYETASALADDIERFLRDEPIGARPPSSAYQLSKFVRRHRVGATAAAAVAVALVGGIIATTAAMIDARAAERRATAAETQAKSLLNEVTTAKQDVIGRLREANRSNIARAQALLQSPQTTEEARQLADSTWAAAHKVLGDEDPLTWAALDLRARVALAQNNARDAESILRGITDSVRRHAFVAPPDAGQYFVHLADAVEAQPGRRAEVEDLLRAAIRYYGIEANAIRERGRARCRLGRMLEQDGDPADAVPVYKAACEDLRRQSDPRNADALDAVNRYRGALIRTGQFELALPLVREQLRDALRELPADNQAIAARTDDLISVLWQMGNKDEARDEFARLVATCRSLRGGLGGSAQYHWRQLVLRAGLDDIPKRWESPSIRGQLWLAMTDLLITSPSGSLMLDELDWDKLQFRMKPWRTPGEPPPAGPAEPPPAPDAPSAFPGTSTDWSWMPEEGVGGNLNDLRALRGQRPGLYLLSVEVPRAGGEPARLAVWLLFTGWDLRLYVTPGGINPADQREQLWRMMTGNGLPAERLTARALLLCDLAGSDGRYAGLHLGTGPGGRMTDFGVYATAPVNLPAGTYRFIATSDDGVRVSVDGEERISSWRSRPTATDSVVVPLAAGTHSLAVGYFQGGADFALRLSAEPMDERAVEWMSAALHSPSPAMRQWLLRQAALWEQAGDLDRAESWYRRAAEVGCRLTTIDRADQARSTQGIARTLARRQAGAGAGAGTVTTKNDAVAVSADVLQWARAARPRGEAEANALIDLARAELAAGRPRGDAAAKLAEAVGLYRTLHPGPLDRRGRDFVRYAQLQALGAAAQAADGSLAAQVLCAADEMLRDEPQPDLDPSDLSRSSVHYRLVPWDPAADSAAADAPSPPDRAAGTLADAAPTDLDPGLYVLSVRIDGGAHAAGGAAGAGGRTLAQAFWVLLAPWELAFHTAEGQSAFDRNTYNASVGREPAMRSDRPGLALLDGFDSGPLPRGSADGFAVTARAKVTLPRGRYRFESTACDGVRLTVDDHDRAINAWPMVQPARTDSAEIDLDGRTHDLRVDYFQGSGGYKLWLRVEPRTPGAQALAARLGARRARTTEQALREQDDALAVDPQNVAAFALRGNLHARDGAWDAAADDYAAAADIEAADPVWPQQRALAQLLAGRADAYEQQREEMYKRMRGIQTVRDRSLAARYVVTALLSADVGRPRPAVFEEWVARATPQPQPKWQQPMCELAMGVLDYRDGKWAAAAPRLAACRDRLPDAARATADLFRAMALEQSGEHDRAAELLGSAGRAIDELTARRDREWDTYLTQDWLTCQIVRREAEGLIPGK